MGVLAALFGLAAALGTAARMLPGEVQALPYVPVIVSATPWFVIPAALALVLALVSRRWFVALVAVACIGAQAWWQWPFFAGDDLPDEAVAAVSQARANTDDAYVRVMTLNVFKGQANPQTIVEAVRDQRVEVLALQETTDAFVAALNEAGIGGLLPYAKVSSSDGVFGNGLWSATPLEETSDTDVDSSASFMPGGTVTVGGGAKLRFVSVHTTSPVPGHWNGWRRSLDELGSLREDTGRRYVLMGDFNATTDHTPLREMMGDRFEDAARISGHGFAFTWPTNRPGVPRFTGIDHVIVDQGIQAGQTQVLPVEGSDHAALLTTLAIS